jgi:MFS family permease
MAQQFWQLLIARVGVGAGEAGLNPSATSMLTDLFPRERLTSAMAVYAMGSTVGSGTAFVVGGLLVEMVSHVDSFTLPLLGEVRSWQLVFFIIGLPGALLALIIFTVPEPARRNRIKTVETSGLVKSSIGAYADLVKFLRSRWRFFLPHYIGFGLASMLISGGSVWYAAHMSRAYGWTPGEIGTYLGVTLMVVGVVGKLICGLCVDEIRSGRRPRDFVGIWPGDTVCMHFGPMSHLPPYDILVTDPGDAPRYGVARRPDGECE